MATSSENPALKHMFDERRFGHIASLLAELDAGFDKTTFIALAREGLDQLSLMQRLRRMTECLHASLAGDYRTRLRLLRRLAPRIDHGFVSMVLPDYVARYGLNDFDVSMRALKFFTRFGSSEFAVRPFLRQDLRRTLAVMQTWSLDADEAVRRLASEGCRPRLPWSFHLEALIADPSPALPILENLRADASVYVRKSVANHLNDISRDHPDWLLARLVAWPRAHPATAWIVKRALRTLIKKGDRRALAMVGVGVLGAEGERQDGPEQRHVRARIKVRDFAVAPRRIRLGERIDLSFTLESQARAAQRLMIDYTVHYVKKSGVTAGKVFKWKELTLAPGAALHVCRGQTVRDFTTRTHHAGRHHIELMINGEVLARGYFDLLPQAAAGLQRACARSKTMAQPTPPKV